MCLSHTYKSPINYTGNKYRLLEQYKSFFPKEVDKFIDLFTGGATVAINVKSNQTLAIDKNKQVIRLLNYLREQEYEKLILKIDKIIEEYNLSNSYKYEYNHYREYIDGNNGLKRYNKLGYEKLKKDYNCLKNKDSKKANLFLYLLMVYGFNNDIRFNSKGEFNLPVGKTDMNKNNRKKLKEYIETCNNKSIKFINADFRKIKHENISENDFVYADPPYLITDAVYNENDGWTKKDEIELLNFLDNLEEKNVKFALSNVIEKKNIKNDILTSWIEKNKEKYYVHDINYHYRSSSYNKKNRDSREREVLITNYKMGE